MTTYIALLRGINVSGKNPITMAELRNSFSGLGFTGVQTYLQSGNVVFSTVKSEEGKLAAVIQKRIAHDLGLEIPVLVISAQELDAIVKSNPLWPVSGGDERLLHGTFLFLPVAPAGFQMLKLPAIEGERAVLAGKVILLHCPHGYGKTKLNNGYFERALKVPATTRNWRTVLALQELCASH
jgi:uncharacterized protein (DUF1697 family)